LVHPGKKSKSCNHGTVRYMGQGGKESGIFSTPPFEIYRKGKGQKQKKSEKGTHKKKKGSWEKTAP